MTRDRTNQHGTVLAYDRVAGTMVVDVRYRTERGDLPRSPYPPLAVPTPAAAPDWLFRVGINFHYTTPAGYRTAAEYDDPHLMRDFTPVDYWWATVAELEAMIGYNDWADGRQGRIDAARAAVESRRPAEYVPDAAAVTRAAERLTPYFPEWVGPDGLPVARPAAPSPV